MRYQDELRYLKSHNNNVEDGATVGKYDALFGRQLPQTNALLSPKMATILKAQKEALHHMHVHPIVDKKDKIEGDSRNVS